MENRSTNQTDASYWRHMETQTPYVSDCYCQQQLSNTENNIAQFHT